MATIRDIARIAGVSVSTASLALNGHDRVRPATRQRVLDAATQLEYHPSHSARSLSVGRTWSLNLLNPLGSSGLSSSFFTRFVRGVHQVAHSHEYSLALTALDDEVEASHEAGKLVRERRADGVILMNLSDDEALVEQLLHNGFPHVLLGQSALSGVATVDSDNEAAARDAAHHLLARGNQPILFLNAPKRHTFAQERAAGYRRAHLEAGLESDEALIRFGFSTAELAREEVRKLLQQDVTFKGLMASSDELAVGALRALRDVGLRVPDDVAIIGMNNDELGEYTDPRLTSIDLNAEELGREAAQLLITTIEGGPVERRLVPHKLVRRESA